MVKVTLGADPEFFLDYKGFPVLAHFFVPGTKARPHKTPHGFIQADGCAIEFNVEPASSKLQFATNVGSVLKDIRAYVPKKYRFDFTPTKWFAPDLWDAIPEEAKEMGCDPDYLADREGRLNEQNPNHYRGNLASMRTGGGHLHIGYGKDLDFADRSTKYDMITIINAMLGTIGNYESIWDYDDTRGYMYGSAGAFRPKSFGVEWRSPSNAWLNHPNLWPWLYEVVDWTVNTSLIKRGDNPRYSIGYRPHTLSYARKAMIPIPERIEELVHKTNEFFKINLASDFPIMPPGTLNYEAIWKAYENGKRLRRLL